MDPARSPLQAPILEWRLNPRARGDSKLTKLDFCHWGLSSVINLSRRFLAHPQLVA